MKHFITFVADFQNQDDEFGIFIRRILKMNINMRWSFTQVELFLRNKITEDERLLLYSLFVHYLESKK